MKVVICLNGVSDAMSSKEREEDIFEGRPVAYVPIKSSVRFGMCHVFDDGRFLFIRDGGWGR